MDKVVLGLSGGVDSAVAAHLLRESGWRFTGCISITVSPARTPRVRPPLPSPFRSRSPTAARQWSNTSAPRLPKRISAARRRTPAFSATRRSNSVLCWTKRSASGQSTSPPGHYARAENGAIYRGQPENDQSYMLCRLTPDEVNALLRRLRHIKKRKCARWPKSSACPSRTSRTAWTSASSRTAITPPGSNARGITPPPGDFVLDGKAVGKHRGIHHYTVGQRRHFGVGFGKRVYVSDICPETNEVRLSSDDAAVWRESFRVRGVNWLVPPEGEIVCGVRIRHSRRELPTGTVTPDGDGAIVRFPAPVRAPTPGQTAAFYDGERLLGGGFIVK